VFNIAQFFPLLNHWALSLIFDKVRFDLKVSLFFRNYLVGRTTQYFWNNFSSPFFNINIGVGQGSALSSILSALYIAPILYILENCLKILNILVSILLFVDNSLLVAQNKSLTISNSLLLYSYQITSSLLERFGLIIEHRKTEVFHFSRLYEVFDSPLLDLSLIGGPILYPKNTWRYLEYIFDRKLFFWQHIDFYVNKAISTVKCMKILRNSVCNLVSQQKHLLYRSCVLPIVLYRFQLQFYNKAPLSYPLKELNKMQRRAAIWILGAFHILSSFGIKAIIGLIPIHLYLQKLSSRSPLRAHSLLYNYIFRSLLE